MKLKKSQTLPQEGESLNKNEQTFIKLQGSIEELLEEEK